MAKRRPQPSFLPKEQDLKKSESRRLAIIEAAIECIASAGIHQLSAFSIGKHTKMRRSHIVYYFPNLEKLIEAAILHVVQIGQKYTVAAMEHAHTPGKRLEAWVDGTLGWLEAYPTHRCMMTLLQHFAMVLPEYKNLQKMIADTGEERVAAILEAGLGSTKRSKQEIRSTARNIRSYIVGELIRYYSSPSPESLAVFRNQLKKHIVSLSNSL